LLPGLKNGGKTAYTPPCRQGFPESIGYLALDPITVAGATIHAIAPPWSGSMPARRVRTTRDALRL
jgi:hypothetical protein